MTKTNIAVYCFGAMVLLGDAILSLSFTGNLIDDIIGFSSAVLLSAASAMLLKALSKLYIGKAFFLLFLSLSVLYTLYNFSLYAAHVMLESKNILLPFLIMAAIALYLGLSEKNVLLKISFIFLAVVIALIVVIAVFSVQFMNAKYLLPYKTSDLSFFRCFLPLYLSLTTAFLPIVITAKKVRETVVPLLIFTILFAVCSINVLGMFGSDFAAGLNYPYAVAVSTAATGEVFSRLDGFFYVICFFTVLTKISATISAFKEVLHKIICGKNPQKN